MPRLSFTVEVRSDDEETDMQYLEKLRATFIHIVDLVPYGYTDNECFCSSSIGVPREGRHTE